MLIQIPPPPFKTDWDKAVYDDVADVVEISNRATGKSIRNSRAALNTYLVSSLPQVLMEAQYLLAHMAPTKKDLPPCYAELWAGAGSKRVLLLC